MDPDMDPEVAFEYPDIMRLYKSGNFERFVDATLFPPYAAAAAGDLTGDVVSKDVLVPGGVSARIYLPPNIAAAGANEAKKLPILVYFHGGGFFYGSAFNTFYHTYVNSVVAKSNVVAVSVEYRLAPEHAVPAAYDDCYAGLKWVLSDSADDWIKSYGDLNRVVVAGDSAGANIVHNVVMRAGTDRLEVDGMVLMCPYFWGSKRLGKEEERRSRLRLEWLDMQWPYFCPSAKENGGNDDPRVNPMAEGSPGLETLGCRRAMVVVAENDALYARGKAYAAALQRSEWGGAVELLEYDGEDHSFHLYERDSAKAIDVMERLIKFLND